MGRNRRWLLVASAALLPLAAVAQDYPSRPVRMVVPYSPGGAVDPAARMMASRLSAAWGQAVVVENRPGAGTIIGTELVVRAAPDGHTLLFTTDPTVTINTFLYRKLPYDPDRDLIPVTQVMEWHQAMSLHPSVPAGSVPELVAHARANPDKLSYGSYGIGSQAHLAAELLKSAAGIDIKHVPYKTGADALTAAARGEVHLTFGSAAIARGLAEGGRLKPVAIGGPRRSPLLPGVPTFAEQGYPAVETHVWIGVFVPAGTPARIVDHVHRGFTAILNDPGFRQREVLDKGNVPVGSSPAEFAAYIKQDRESRGRAVKLAGITPE